MFEPRERTGNRLDSQAEIVGDVRPRHRQFYLAQATLPLGHFQKEYRHPFDGVLPAKHEEFDEHPELGYPYLGYVLRLGGVTVYNAGDTIAYPGLVERLAPLAIDLAFLPINGRDFFRTSAGTIGNMDYREAAELAIAADIQTIVPVHYGMFAHNSAPPGHLVSYLAERDPARQIHILGRYGLYIYTRP